MTVLDESHAEMEAAPDDAARRLRFYERLADAELLLLLERPISEERIAPQVFPLEDEPVVLVFDTAERLTSFAEGAAYAELSGRTLVGMLAGQGLGLGLNLGVAPSSILLPSSAVDWLAATLADAPENTEARPEEIIAPSGIPERLISALDAKFPGLAGLAVSAALAGVRYTDGRQGHILAFLGAVPGAERALASAVREALVFSGMEAGELDVVFPGKNDPLSERLGRVALRFDLPSPVEPNASRAPGTDPNRPPKLR